MSYHVQTPLEDINAKLNPMRGGIMPNDMHDLQNPGLPVDYNPGSVYHHMSTGSNIQAQIQEAEITIQTASNQIYYEQAEMSREQAEVSNKPEMIEMDYDPFGLNTAFIQRDMESEGLIRSEEMGAELEEMTQADREMATLEIEMAVNAVWGSR